LALTVLSPSRPQGTDAIRAMYSVVGLGWLAFLMELPFFTQVMRGKG
jgi:hypothetical protein